MQTSSMTAQIPRQPGALQDEEHGHDEQERDPEIGLLAPGEPVAQADGGAWGDGRQPAWGHHGQQVAGAAHLLGEVAPYPARAGDLLLQRDGDERPEDHQAHGERGGGIAHLPRRQRRLHRHQGHEQQAAHDQRPGEQLDADQRLRGAGQAEGHAEPDRRAVLVDYDLLDQDQQPRQQEDQDQVEVVGVGHHRRREAVDQPADRGHAVVGHIAANRQIGAPGRQAIGEGDQQVEAQHRPKGQSQRRQQQARQRHPGVPHQVDAVGVVEVVAEQW
jgi:hypothetical protein